MVELSPVEKQNNLEMKLKDGCREKFHRFALKYHLLANKRSDFGILWLL